MINRMIMPIWVCRYLYCVTIKNPVPFQLCSMCRVSVSFDKENGWFRTVLAVCSWRYQGRWGLLWKDGSGNWLALRIDRPQIQGVQHEINVFPERRLANTFWPDYISTRSVWSARMLKDCLAVYSDRSEPTVRPIYRHFRQTLADWNGLKFLAELGL